MTASPSTTPRNRLRHETSPYLVQHAGNPVDWYPWGSEALELARRLQRPILLSIGYSACHWCHVMAHESFEDPDTAAVMNELGGTQMPAALPDQLWRRAVSRVVLVRISHAW